MHAIIYCIKTNLLVEVKKIVFTLLALALVCQSADAQFFKKLFKKKAKTEAKAPVAADGIDDDAQLALADIASCSDNRNNRNAFLNIPLGIKADRFEKLLLQQGFVERKNEGAQTSKTYYYEGEVYGAKSLITLAVSEQTGRVYAVDVEDQTVYPSEQAVKQRFASLKKELVKVYGGGFIDNQGEAYTIQSRLGTVNMHYERNSLAACYTIGFALDDAKAYEMAYQEMEDKAYETAPRTITDGLAEACNHTDLVGLGVKLLQNKTVKGAQEILLSYDYSLGKTTNKALSASLTIGDYKVVASLTRRKQTITAITLTANDNLAAVYRDLETNGFTSANQKTWQQGKMSVTVSADKQGRVVLLLR